MLLVREDPEYYDESEVVVDPFRLGRISLLERLSYTGQAEADLRAIKFATE